MKTLVSLLFALVVGTGALTAQESIRPIVSPEFGKPVTVRAEFVAKSNDYYSQNMVSAPYRLKVLAVDGRELKKPVLIEYNLRVEHEMRSKIERSGIISNFEAYESLYQPAMATPWLSDGEQGTSFALIHVLNIRPLHRNG